MSTLQSLLLMTYYYESPEDRKGAWYWSGVSLSFAYSLGIDREKRRNGEGDQFYSLRKRLWWSCYMRDKEIALAMRRPTRIRDFSFATSLLELDDFDLTPFSVSVANLTSGSPISSVVIRRHLATQCIEKTRLCLHISTVLNGQYSLSKEANEVDKHPNMMMMPQRPGLTKVEVVTLDEELEQWCSSMPLECQREWLADQDNFNNGSSELLILHADILESLFCVTSNALHRQRGLGPLPAEVELHSLWKLSRFRVIETGNKLTDIIKELNERNLTGFLPPFGVTTLLTAALVQLHCSSLHDLGHPSALRTGLKDCVCALQVLTKIYASAEYARDFLATLVRRRSISIPQHGLVDGKAIESNLREPSKSSLPRDSLGREHRRFKAVGSGTDTAVPRTAVDSFSAHTILAACFDGSEMEESLDTSGLSFETMADLDYFFDFEA